MGGHDHDPFTELADAARADEAVRERTAARSLHRQAAEEATLAGLVLDLAENGDAVALRTRSGRVHRGRVTAVGANFAVVGEAWVPLAAVVSVRTDPARRAHEATGGRAAPRGVRLSDALGELATERPHVVVVADGGEAVRGSLRSAGADVLTLVLDGDSRARCHIPLTAVTEVLVVTR